MVLIFGAFLAIGLIYIAVVALQGPKVESGGLSGVDPELLVAFQTDPDTLTLIDSRSPGEYSAAHIPGAVNIPFDALKGNEALLPADKAKLIVIHCKTGRRAGKLKEQLDAIGYTNVEVLPSELMTWGEDGPTGLNPVGLVSETN